MTWLGGRRRVILRKKSRDDEEEEKSGRDEPESKAAAVAFGWDELGFQPREEGQEDERCDPPDEPGQGKRLQNSANQARRGEAYDGEEEDEGEGYAAAAQGAPQPSQIEKVHEWAGSITSGEAVRFIIF